MTLRASVAALMVAGCRDTAQTAAFIAPTFVRQRISILSQAPFGRVVHPISTPYYASSATSSSSTSRVLWSSIETERPATASESSSSSSSSSDSFNVSNYRGIHELNAEMDRLAEKCGDGDYNNNNNNSKKSGHVDHEDVISVAAECEHLLQQALQQAANNDNHNNNLVQPDIITYNIVIKAWARAAGALAEGRGRNVRKQKFTGVPVYTARDAAQRALDLLTDMEQRYTTSLSTSDESSSSTSLVVVVPDKVTYNAVIDAWSSSREADAGQQAEKILERIKSLSSQNNKDSDAWSHLHADSITYQGVMDCWSQCASDEAYERVRELWTEMKTLYEAGGSNDTKPTIRTVNSVLHVLARRGSFSMTSSDDQPWEHAKQAETLLRDAWKTYNATHDMGQMPDVTTYTTVMDAYSRIGNVKAAERVDVLLQELENHNKHRLKPNVWTYTTAITAWSRTRTDKGAQRASAILEQMKQRGEQPSTRTYTGVMNAWGRSKDPSKAVQCLRLLKEMRELVQKKGRMDVKPNLYTYNAAIDACAKCHGTPAQEAEALKIAFAVFKALQADKDVSPNHVTYASLTRAAAFLLPPGKERNDVAVAVFVRCRKAGMVNESVLKSMRIACDLDLQREVFKELLETSGYINFSKAPPEWSRHV